jgi:hypothetical protein
MAKTDWETSLDALDTAAKSLREAMVASLDKGDGDETSDMQKKMDALDEQIAKVKAKAFPDDSEPDKSKDGKAADTKKDDEAAKAKGKGKQFPPGKPGDDEDEEGGMKGKAKKDDDADKGDDKDKADAKKGDDSAVPWPRDLASKDFREGVEKKDDPLRGWGKDPE